MPTPRVRRWLEDGAIEAALGRRLFVRRRGGGVEAIELPDAAHYPQLERPDPISAALDRALERASR